MKRLAFRAVGFITLSIAGMALLAGLLHIDQLLDTLHNRTLVRTLDTIGSIYLRIISLVGWITAWSAVVILLYVLYVCIRMVASGGKYPNEPK